MQFGARLTQMSSQAVSRSDTSATEGSQAMTSCEERMEKTALIILQTRAMEVKQVSM